MLIGVLVSAWIVAPRFPGTPVPAAAFAQAISQPPEAQEPRAGKKPKADKTKQEKKLKKKKAAKDTGAAPDEPVDAEADPRSSGVRFSWKQHPSMRIGDLFRLDVEAKLQEDGHSSYGRVKGLDTWELHRNRVGVKGYLTKQVEYEVEHEFTERELTERDIAVGITAKSRWKDVNVNLRYVKGAQIQIGKFKVPFGLDEVTGVTHNDFVYRAPFGERGPDLPAKAEREVCRIQQQQRARRRGARRCLRDRQLLKDA